MSVAAAPDAGALAVAFSRVLRGTGTAAPLDSVLTFVEALGRTGIEDRTGVYWAARCTLVRSPEDIGAFDAAFAVFWDHFRPGASPPVIEEPITLALDAGDDGAERGSAESGTEPDLVLRFSGVETLRRKDFAACTDDEMRLVSHWMAALRFAGPPRTAQRWVKSPRGRRPDLRRTVRASIAAQGEPVRRQWARRGTRARRLVFLLDVSGSMEPYARALLRYVQAGVAGRQRVEAFTLGTRLTRVSRELASRDPDRAMRLAGASVADWSGGTRLGETLRSFNDAWGVRGMARGAIVVILSDGWDRGDPGLLAGEMERLQRVAFRTVWVNPLKVTPGYAPLARGMAAALPFIDEFVEGHSLSALENLTKVINRA